MAEIARGAGARLAVDNTVPTPLLTRPLALGADIVMHSCTKYLNGHSDVLGGALIAAKDDEFWQRVSGIRDNNGGALGPFEAWLLLRGLRTLHLRLRESAPTRRRWPSICRATRAWRRCSIPASATIPAMRWRSAR